MLPSVNMTIFSFTNWHQRDVVQKRPPKKSTDSTDHLFWNESCHHAAQHSCFGRNRIQRMSQSPSVCAISKSCVQFCAFISAHASPALRHLHVLKQVHNYQPHNFPFEHFVYKKLVVVTLILHTNLTDQTRFIATHEGKP